MGGIEPGLSGVPKMRACHINSAKRVVVSAAIHMGRARDLLPRDICDQTAILRACKILAVLVPRDLGLYLG